MLKHASPISGIACYENLVCTAGYDNKLILWDHINLHAPVAIARSNHDHLVNHCCFDATGKFILTASSDYSARLWSVPDLKLISIFNGHTDDVEMAIFSPDNKTIATASRDHSIRIYDFSGNTKSILYGHRSDVISVIWSTNYNEILSSSDDGTVRRWNIITNQEIEKYDFGDVETDTLITTNDGTIYVGDDDGIITSHKNGKINRVKAHDSGIKRIFYNSNSHQIISSGYDQFIRIWNITNDSIESNVNIKMPDESWARAICVNTSTKRLLTGSFGYTFCTYDLLTSKWSNIPNNITNGINTVICDSNNVWSSGDSGKIKCNNATICSLGSLINTISILPNGILAAGHKGVIYYYDKKDNCAKEVYKYSVPINTATSVDYDDFSMICLGCYSGEVILLKSLHNNNSISFCKKFRLFNNAIKGISSYSQEDAFAVCANGNVAWFDFKGTIIKEMKSAHSKIANGCICLNNNEYASISRDKHLYLWKDRNLVSKISTPHTHSIKCICYDYPWIITGSYSGWIHFYNYKLSTWSKQNARPTQHGISSLCIQNCSEKKRIILAGSYDGSLYSIELPDCNSLD